jgi:hypothetical protein
VQTGSLDLSKGSWVELELVGSGRNASTFHVSGGLKLASASGQGQVVCDNVAASVVQCSGICMDFDGSDFVNLMDFLLMVGSLGETTDAVKGDSLHCLEGPFSSDGYVDTQDVLSKDWVLSDASRQNLCVHPPSLRATSSGIAYASSVAPASAGQLAAQASDGGLAQGLLVLEKEYRSDSFGSDWLGLFTADGQFAPGYSVRGVPSHCNARLVQGGDQGIFLVNLDKGILRLDASCDVVIPPGKVCFAGNPAGPATTTVYVGIQANVSGRPILDVAFDKLGYAYVVPVVAQEDGGEPYVAAAKLKLTSGNPPYEVNQVYAIAKDAKDNACYDSLREIEVDASGNVYVLNAHRLNESDTLWKFDAQGTNTGTLVLGKRDAEGFSFVPDPVALCLSEKTQTLYLASGLCDRYISNAGQADPNGTWLYRFSMVDLSAGTPIRIRNVQHVTAITADPEKGSLWVAGIWKSVVKSRAPGRPVDVTYYACIAKVPENAGGPVLADVVDQVISGPSLLVSAVWTGRK